MAFDIDVENAMYLLYYEYLYCENALTSYVYVWDMLHITQIKQTKMYITLFI